MVSSAERPRKRAVRADHRQNHDRLLTAALELFDERGIDVPLREVGERAGISQASVFRHFANREQLITEVYDQASADLSDRVAAVLADTIGAGAAQRLDALLATVADVAAEHPCYGRLASRGAALYPERVTDPVVVDGLATLIGEAQAAGLLAPDVTDFDLILAPLLIAGTLPQDWRSSVMGQRMMIVMRRGLAPGVAAVAPLPALP